MFLMSDSFRLAVFQVTETRFWVQRCLQELNLVVRIPVSMGGGVGHRSSRAGGFATAHAVAATTNFNLNRMHDNR